MDMEKVILLLASMTVAAHVLAEEAAPGMDWREVLAQTGLLPGKASGYGAVGLGYLEEQLGRKLTPDETALLKTGDDGARKTHTDELISFDLPDHPLLKVDVLKSEEKPELRIVGGAVGTTDNSFERVYRITFSDGVPYGFVLVTEAEWFDDGDPFKEREPYTTPLAPEDLTLILSEFHRHAPKAGGDEWDFWCGVIADLARGGVKNPEAVELIVERRNETDIPQFQTRWVLELYERPELREFVHHRIRLLMGDDENVRRQGGEFGNLLSSLEHGDADAAGAVRPPECRCRSRLS
ncbi:MAG: hypothetical protein ACO3JG_03370 [Luteolibacter sp.]